MADCRSYFTRALNSENPAQALDSICALDRGASISALSERFGLPHHAEPGGPPDRDCVAAAMSALAGGRTGSPMSGPGVAEARSHLMAHERALGMGGMAEGRGFAEPVEVRSSTIADVNVRQRLIDLIAVPWEQEAEVFWRGELWHEVFTRGAFAGLEEHAGRVRVNREHVIGQTVGKVVTFTDGEEGELARLKIAQTQLGDDTLALAEEDMISASVGYQVQRPSDVRINNHTRTRRVNRAYMRHLAMVESPAYEGAQVLAVRAEPSGLQVVEAQPLPPTPALDEFLNDPVLLWAQGRRA